MHRMDIEQAVAIGLSVSDRRVVTQKDVSECSRAKQEAIALRVLANHVLLEGMKAAGCKCGNHEVSP